MNEDRISVASGRTLKTYIDFREKQVLKAEACISESEFAAMEKRVDELRRSGEISLYRYLYLKGQLQALKRWNTQNLI